MLVFGRHSWLPFPVKDVFGCHVRQGAFERLAPPWEDRRVGRQVGALSSGGACREAQYAMANAWATLSRRASSSSMNAATSAREIFLPFGGQ